ncbi:MAG: transposase [Acidimicrobiales bacterium]|nr:transposase [Acidimicrobiales bacterium]
MHAREHSNEPTEGLNRLIKWAKRLFGYRNLDNYRLKILYGCQPLSSTPPATTDPIATLGS